MNTLLIKYSSVLAITILLSACGGGSSSSTPEIAVTPEPVATPETPLVTNLSDMVDGIIAENVDHADHTTWNLNNFDMVDDIDGNVEAETAMNAMVDAMILADQAKP